MVGVPGSNPGDGKQNISINIARNRTIYTQFALKVVFEKGQIENEN